MNQMKFSLLELLFFFLLQLEISYSSDPLTESFCPNPTDLEPCLCSMSYFGYDEPKYDIKCQADQLHDLASVFTKISEDPRVLNTTYKALFLEDKAITELPKGAIGQLKFEEILITTSCSNLKKIHQQAFESSSGTTRILWIDNSINDINTTPYSLLGLVNSFQCLEELRINEMFSVLQDRAFSENLTSLTNLILKIYELEGSPFYNLPNLSTLDLTEGKISYISSNAFKFNKRELASLDIKLGRNNLNDSSFEIGAFMKITGSVHLALHHNQITYLDEQVFAPFLDAHEDNKINLYGNPLNCYDCRSFWLFKNENWKTNNQISGLYCQGDIEMGTIWKKEYELKEQCGHISYASMQSNQQNVKSSFLMLLFATFISYSVIFIQTNKM